MIAGLFNFSVITEWCNDCIFLPRNIQLIVYLDSDFMQCYGFEFIIYSIALYSRPLHNFLSPCLQWYRFLVLQYGLDCKLVLLLEISQIQRGWIYVCIFNERTKPYAPIQPCAFSFLLFTTTRMKWTYLPMARFGVQVSHTFFTPKGSYYSTGSSIWDYQSSMHSDTHIIAPNIVTGMRARTLLIL